MIHNIDFSTIQTIKMNGVDIDKLILDGLLLWERYIETTTYEEWVTSGYTTNVAAGASQIQAGRYMVRDGSQYMWNYAIVSSSQYEAVGVTHAKTRQLQNDNGGTVHEYYYRAIRRRAYSYYTDTSHYETRYNYETKYRFIS